MSVWSDEDYELYVTLLRLGLLPDICNYVYLQNYFQTLFFVKQGLDNIDTTMLQFYNLKILDLSNNKITVLENVPPHLEELRLNSNLIDEIRGPVQENLLHLGLSYNLISNVDSDPMQAISTFFPNLFSLNLSFNQLENLDTTVTQLQALENLKILILQGNPLSLTNNC